MTIAYGKHHSGGSGMSADAAKPVNFDMTTFMRNRMARLYPMYLVVNLLHLGAENLNNGGSIYSSVNGSAFIFRDVVSLFLGNMWLYPFLPFLSKDLWFGGQSGHPVAGVAWTIQTMLSFYIFFPFVLRWLRKTSDYDRRAQIVECYWVQSTWFGYQLFCPGVPSRSDSGFGYWVGRAFPLGRLPVFMMGCMLASERMHGDWKPGATRSGEDIFQLNLTICCPNCCDRRSVVPAMTAEGWGSSATTLMSCYLGGIFSVVTFLYVLGLGWLSWLVSVLIRILLEQLMPMVFCKVIIALTMCEKKGTLYNLMAGKFFMTLGNISFSVYLVHMFALMMSFSIFKGSGGLKFICSTLMTFVLGFGFTHLVEKPIQRMLRKKRN